MQADGVALGGVQALYARLLSQEQRLRDLASRREAEQVEANQKMAQAAAALTAAEERAAMLESRLARLEAIVLQGVEAAPAR